MSVHSFAIKGTHLVRNARVNKLRNVRRFLVSKGAELKHEVADR